MEATRSHSRRGRRDQERSNQSHSSLPPSCISSPPSTKRGTKLTAPHPPTKTAKATTPTTVPESRLVAPAAWLARVRLTETYPTKPPIRAETRLASPGFAIRGQDHPRRR